MDPIHFGIVMVLNMCIGICTPPVGSVLFVGCSVSKLPINKNYQTYAAILCRDGIGAGNGDLYSANQYGIAKSTGLLMRIHWRHLPPYLLEKEHL